MVLTQVNVEGLFRPANPGSDSYPANSNTDWFYFGTNESVETYEVSNNVERIGQLGSRESAELLEQNFEGSFSVTFDLAYDPSVAGDDAGPNGFEWLEAITTATAGGDLDGAESTADAEDFFDFNDVNWFDLAIDRPSATTITYATGCVATSFTIEANVDETITVSMDGFFADMDNSTDVTDADIQSRVGNTANFDEVEVSYGGSTLNCPQGVTIDAENNVTPFRCLDGANESRTIQAIGTGNFNPSVSITDLIDFSNNGVSALDRALGGSQTSVDDGSLSTDTINFNLYRGGTQEVAIELDGALTDTYSMSGITADAEAVEQEINETARSLSIDTNTS